MAQERFDFRYQPRTDGRITVAINSRDYYTKTLSYARSLNSRLRSAIPFPCKRSRETEINVLGGMRVKGMLTVELIVTPRIPMDEAVKMLEQADWWKGLESTLT